MGPVYAAGLLAEIGDVHRFPDDNALAKYAGLTWRQHQSGHFAADNLPLTRSGNVYLRYYLLQAANSVRVREPEYAAFYERKYREARHHHHKRALVLTARKLASLVFALLNEGQIYQPRRKTSERPGLDIRAPKRHRSTIGRSFGPGISCPSVRSTLSLALRWCP